MYILSYSSSTAITVRRHKTVTATMYPIMQDIAGSDEAAWILCFGVCFTAGQGIKMTSRELNGQQIGNGPLSAR
jgi:hypothetical protein